jgi:hypothetical protein
MHHSRAHGMVRGERARDVWNVLKFSWDMVSGDRVGPSHPGSPLPDRNEPRTSHEDSSVQLLKEHQGSRAKKLVSQQMLDEIGVRHRIAYPFSRLLRLRGVMPSFGSQMSGIFKRTDIR